jgi:PhnB protein
MTQINGYLHFNGNCRNAMTFYRECLGGGLSLQTVAESPMAGEMPAEMQQRILHATLTKNGLVLLMASDMIGAQLVAGNAVSLIFNCRSEQEINDFFSGLAAGGTVTDPLSGKFWGDTFGALTDQFGINWLLNYGKNSKA